jgi:acyl dehydratase
VTARTDEQPASPLRPVAFPVEEGKVRELVAAIAHPSRVYRPDGAPGDGLPAPLVFSRASVFVEPRATPVSDAVGTAPSHLRHAGHQWDVTLPLVAGRTYHVARWEPAGERLATASTGQSMRFAEFGRTITFDGGECVQRERMTVVAATSLRPPSLADEHRDRANVPPPAATVREARPWLGQPPGTVVERVDAAWLTRTSIVRFAGAIGDFTLVHHDVDTARRLGLPDVIAMGMLPAALLLARVETALGPSAVRACAVRFRRVVYPGEPIELEVCAEGTVRPMTEAFDLRLFAAGVCAVAAIVEADRRASEEWMAAG